MKYVVICYAVHNRGIASYDSFDSEDEANEFLEQDAKNTYEEEYDNSDEETRETIDFECGDGTATLSSCNGEYVWTWEIIEIR